MRLEKLELERFGPFVGQSLTLRPHAKLHVVYGANEAGKSCALAAVIDLLFGIERQTRYDFLHDQRELRIGAIIADRTGHRLRFRRRKGNKNTLLDLDTNAALPEDALVRYLGAITREVFCNAFGLNAHTLRSGAEEMLMSEGEVGASLFAAASGLRGLNELRQQLDTEANTIFAPRASKERTFYQALDRFTAANRAIRERELKAGYWKDLNEKIDRLETEHTSINQKRQDNRAEHARLSRLKRVGPQIAQIDTDFAALAALGDLPNVEAGFSGLLETGIATRNAALQTRDRIGRDEQQARDHLAAITLNPAPLARAADIVTLFGELGAYTKAQADIPAVEREAQLFAGQLNDYARRLGIPDAPAMQKARPSDAALALARALIAEGTKLQTSLSTNSTELAEEQEKLEQLANEAELQGPAVDPKPYSDRLAALAPQLRQLDRHVELAENFAKVRRQLEEGASRLKPALPAPIDAIATSELPSVETLARIRKTLDGIDRDRDRLTDRLSEIEASIRKHEQHLTAFVSERPVPTREAITAQRGHRDVIWQGLRSTLLGGADPLPPAAVPQSVREFERHMADADGLSDDALADASRVAEFAATERHLAQARCSHVELQDTLATLDRGRQAEWTAYEKEWSRSGISRPLPPAEMVVWLDGVGKLLEKREEARDAEAKLDALNATMKAVAPEVIRLAAVVGLDELSGLEPPVLALRIEVRLREMTEAWNQRRDLETSVRAARERVAKLLRQQKSLEERREDWQARWQPAVTTISADGATLEQAQAALDVWQAVPATASAHDDRAGRVVAMRTDMAGFATKIAGVVKAVAPDLEGLAPESALRQLNTRLSEATQASTRHAEAERHLAEVVRKKEKAELDLADTETSLGQLVKRLPGDVDLLELCQRLKSRDSLVQSLAKLRSQLLTQADGLPEEELRSQLADFDPDLTIGVVKNLDIENDYLDRSANETFAEHKAATNERTSLEQGGGAELAALQKRSAEAEMIASAREWSVLKLGATLLGATIDQQRSSQQDPLMRRAGELLATITGGALSGLGQEFDDKDILRLVGQRPGGEVVHVEGMSEGARDQLYLALRLAYLEDYAKRSEPIPFIGDDLFMTFDDARTMNGLIALASLSQDMQPILFTHHKHVVELAQEALGHDVDVMEIDSTARFLRQADAGA